MADLKYPQWQKPYEEALLERDPQKLQEKLMKAETAIFLRLQELSSRTNHHEERLAIEDAIPARAQLTDKEAELPGRALLAPLLRVAIRESRTR